MKAVDLDEEIERQSGRSIPELFRNVGESGFRFAEQAALVRISEATQATSIVLATGGGIVTSAFCREILRREYTAIWLQASPITIAKRIEVQQTIRPLLGNSNDVIGRLSVLLSERRAMYQEVAAWSVNVDGKDIAAVADEICQKGVWLR